MKAEFLKRSKRDYTSKRDGERRTAHHVAVILDDGSPAEFYVSEDVYHQAEKLERGAPIAFVIGATVFRGEGRLQIEGVVNGVKGHAAS